MKINIPNLDENGVKVFTLPYVEREANEDYFNTIDDAKKYIFDNYCDETFEKLNKRTDEYEIKTYSPTQMINQLNIAINDIENCILNKKCLSCLKNDYNSITNNKILLRNMDEYMKSKYEVELEKLRVIHRNNLIQRNNFIKDNKDEIIAYLNLIKQGYIDNIKTFKKEYIQKWRQNRNELLGIKPREKLTEEQKLENLKETKKKYYNKIKSIVLNELQNNEKTDIQIELIVPTKIELTEKELKRKECNKKYYEKRKQLKQAAIIT